MKVKPWAGFIADFPDDQVEEEGDITLFGGRNVAVAIGGILTGLGCRVSAPEYAELHGWDFDVYYQDRRFWCQVTSFHPAFHLLLEDPAVTGGTRRKNAVAYAELAEKLGDALAADPRFSRVGWRSRGDGPLEPDEIRSARAHGSSSPIELDDRTEDGSGPGGLAGCLVLLLGLYAALVGIVTLGTVLVQPEFDSIELFGFGSICLVVGVFLVWWVANRHR